MWSSAPNIAAGDVVIIWQTRDSIAPLTITPGQTYNSKFGCYPHNALIGLPYGCRVYSKTASSNRHSKSTTTITAAAAATSSSNTPTISSTPVPAPNNKPSPTNQPHQQQHQKQQQGIDLTNRGYIHLLRPTPELWTLALPHRTQILYAADIAFVMGMLDVKPGSRVVEAGTGSGSFSHAVARSVKRVGGGGAGAGAGAGEGGGGERTGEGGGEGQGRLWSFEFHEVRAGKAREEFSRHGLDDIITLSHRNVCKDGFGIVSVADSVFLDLPAPWLAIDHAKEALRKDRPTYICCFSPCIEQVLRTVNALNTAGFISITMYESLSRPHDVFARGACLSLSEGVDEAGERLKRAEIKREEKRLKQVDAARREWERKQAGEVVEERGEKGKRKRDDAGKSDDDDDEAVLSGDSKRAKVVDTVEEETTTTTSFVPTSEPMLVSRALTEVRGHTSYLTFATLVPRHPNAREMIHVPEKEIQKEE